MKNKFLLSLLLVAIIQPGANAAKATSCKFEPSLEQVINTKLTTQEAALRSLETIKNSVGTGAVPLSALFSISVDNPTAVISRVKELEASNEKALESISPYSEWIPCADPKTKPLLTAAIKNQIEIDRSKLEILKLPDEERVRLLTAYGNKLGKADSLAALDAEALLSEGRRKTALEGLEKAEAIAASNSNSDVKNDAGNFAVAQKFLVELENNQLAFIQYKVTQTKKYEEIKTELTQLLPPVTQKPNPEVILTAYTRANEIWRELVDHIFELYLSDQFLTTPEMPNFPAHEPAAEGEPPNPEDEKLKKTYSDIVARVDSTNVTRIEYIHQEKEMISGLLLKAGAIRSKLFNQCRTSECTNLFEISGPIIQDILREYKIVPFKAFALVISKTVEAKQKAAQGVKGWVDLSSQILSFALLLFLPFVFFYILRWAEKKIDAFRKNLINKSMLDYKSRTTVAIWISRLNPFLPWVGMLVFTYTAEWILGTTDVSELAEVTFYLRLYFYYRILLLFLRSAFVELLSQVTAGGLQGSAEKIQKSSLAVARIIFIEIIILHATSNAVREAYVYTFMSFLIKYGNIVLIFQFSRNWKTEIRQIASSKLPPKISAFLEKLESRFAHFLLTPVLLVAVILMEVGNLAYKWLITLNITKWISSEIFKQRLQKDGEKRTGFTPLPEDYRKFFDFQTKIPASEFVATKGSLENEIFELIQDWGKGQSDDDAIVLHGNRGLGKTTLVRRLIEQLDGKALVDMRVPPKMIRKSDFWKFLSTALGAKIESTEDFLSFDANCTQKQVLFLDDAQNLFLAQIGKLDVYRELQDILNLPTKNVFWCIVLNSKSWTYLQGVFGLEHFYGRIFEAKPWSDHEIQSLILSRQKRSGYSYRFDSTIKAFAANQETPGNYGSQAESQFFRLLWGQSRGNPRSALVYWLTALDYDPKAKATSIGVPRFLESQLVSGLSDEALFVLAAITRHENLDFNETGSVTGISNSVVKKCLKQMEKRALIWKDSQDRYRVTPRAQYLVDFYLLGKNFIHE